jgi:hypothetical protein
MYRETQPVVWQKQIRQKAYKVLKQKCLQFRIKKEDVLNLKQQIIKVKKTEVNP